MIPEDHTVPLKATTLQEYRHFNGVSNIENAIDSAQKALGAVAQIIEEERHNAEHGNSSTDKDYARLMDETDASFKQTMNAQLGRLVFTRHLNEKIRGIEAEIGRHEELTPETYESSAVERPEISLKSELDDQVKSALEAPESQKFGSEASVENAYKLFRQEIFYVTHPGDEELHNINQFYSDYDEEEEEMTVAQERVSYKCPLSGTYFEDPVTSQVCNHTFSKQAIFAITPRRGTITCPIPGCQHSFGQGDLVPNEDIARRTKARRDRELAETQQRIQTLERL